MSEPKQGIRISFVDTTNLQGIKDAITPETKAIMVESPTNPMLRITDIAEVAAIAKANNLLLFVDNTFASPFLQSPLALGADAVIHSCTKFIAGHTDAVMGALCTSNDDLITRMRFLQNTQGSVPSPLTALC